MVCLFCTDFILIGFRSPRIRNKKVREFLGFSRLTDLSFLPLGRPPEVTRRPNVRRVLTLDGGGMRGLLTISILKQIEADTNKKVPSQSSNLNLTFSDL